MSHNTTTRYIGLDVHLNTITIAVAEPGRQAARGLATIANDTALLIKQLRRLGF